jgi:hypothetical protein
MRRIRAGSNGICEGSCLKSTTVKLKDHDRLNDARTHKTR